MSEAVITINGVQLSESQSMTVRNAVANYHTEMSKRDALGCDQLGREITQGYRERSWEIMTMINANLITR